MKVAVASQNRRKVTGHTGRCRRFWIYDIENKVIAGKELLELSEDQTFHAGHGQPANTAHPLDGVDVLINGGMGQGLVMRLRRKNIIGIITSESDPDTAVMAYLAGSLETEQAHQHGHDHDHNHDHQH